MKPETSSLITVEGRVQGVGFRPFVCRVAKEMGITGTVRNLGGVVEIKAKGSEGALLLFMEKIRMAAPPIGVERLSCVAMENFEATDFRAVESSGEAAAPVFPADLGICADCARELADERDRRHGYPYISCTACGPRYTMIRGLPYDRERTAMDAFPLCEDCAEEYRNETDRRCHAESISCHACGPQLWGLSGRLGEIEKDAAMAEAISLVREGDIILVKALGGYQLVCRGDEEAARRLRRLKHREGKPFGLLVSSIAEAEKLVVLSETEKEWLSSPARPMVLAKRRAAISPAVAGEVPRLGVMLPSTGFYALLAEGAAAPLIVTSANRSGMPMIYKDDEAKKFYEAHEDIAGIFGYHREILRPADDSVVQGNGNHCQLIRRTRGFLPEPAAVGPSVPVLAFGADMAPGFCLAGGGRFYPAEIPCDLTAEGAETYFLETERDWEKLLGITPKAIVCDKHPRYVSRALAERISRERNLPLFEVQHHHAHALSVMAEHGLTGRALAFVFDGTGYGDDGTIWGGEILLCDGISMERVGHLTPTTLIGGDLSMQQAWKTALGYLAAAGLPSEDPRYGLVKAAISGGVNTIPNSSMGRLFDAAAAILGVADENRFKGECAMALETAAGRALDEGRKGNPISWHGKEEGGRLLWDPRPLMEAMVARRGTIEEKALAFHHAIIDMVVESAQFFGEENIILSGGCFLNQILMTGAKEKLESLGHKVYTNQAVPPGDGGLALGQAWYGSGEQR